MQVTKTVRNVPLSNGHRHEVVNATGRSRHRWRFAPDCPACQSNAVWDRQRLAPSPDKHGPASYPTPCSQQVWGRGCWEATDCEQWKPEPLAAVTRPSHGPYGPVNCPAEKWSRQKLHGYRAASPVSAAHPDNMFHLVWCHEYEVGSAQLRHTDRYHDGLCESCPSAQQPTRCNVPLLWRCRSLDMIVLRIFWSVNGYLSNQYFK